VCHTDDYVAVAVDGIDVVEAVNVVATAVVGCVDDDDAGS
jgi:hypothetical protein